MVIKIYKSWNVSWGKTSVFWGFFRVNFLSSIIGKQSIKKLLLLLLCQFLAQGVSVIQSQFAGYA